MKLFNKTLFILIILFGFLACKNNKDATEKNITTDKKSYKIGHIELNHIPDSTYKIIKESDDSIIFKKLSNSTSTTISIRTFDGQQFSDDSKFTLFAENYISEQMKKYKMKSLHYDIAGFKNTTCLKFDGTYRDTITQDKNKEFISQDGYLCQMPNTESKITEIKVTHLSSERLMPKSVVYQYQSFIEQLKFIED